MNIAFTSLNSMLFNREDSLATILFLILKNLSKFFLDCLLTAGEPFGNHHTPFLHHLIFVLPRIIP